jgi:hypothetical protein
VIALVVIVLDEGPNLRREVARQVLVLEQDAVLECLVPALDLTLDLGMAGRSADVLDALLVEPFREIGGEVAGGGREQPWLVSDLFLTAA